MINQLKAIGCDVIKDAPLKQYTTFKIGGNCDYLIKPNTIEQLKQSIGLLKSEKMPYYILGNGSNVLISSNGVKKAVILMNNLDEIYINQDKIIVQAGAMLSAVCKKAKENSLAGMEFAYGIPGFVGGAVYMNAGAYGGEIKDILTECTVLTDNEIITLKNKDCDFSYRHSKFMNNDSIILSATFCLKKGNLTEIQDKMNNILNRRKEKQPLEYPSAGSTFKRPNGNYASALIEECGLKGMSVGGAMVSKKHSGFIINYNNATSEDVLSLIQKVKDIVKEKTRYDLQCEVKYLD